MNLVDLVGWSAAVVGALFSLPQFVRVLRTGNTTGLSQLAWQLQTAVPLAWLAHGVIYAMPNQIACNVVVVSSSLGVIYFLVRHRGLSWPRIMAPVLLLAGTLAAIDFFFGQLAFGLAVLAPGSLGLLVHLRELVRARDFSGVSPGFLLVGLLGQSLWLSWSFMIGDPAVTVQSTTLVALLLANLVVWVVRTLAGRRVVDAWAPERNDTSVAT